MIIETLVNGQWVEVSEDKMLDMLTVDAVPTIAERIIGAVEAKATRAELAVLYREAIIRKQDGEPIDFAAINAAILTRFKPSGLIWIKEKAWGARK